MRLKKNKSPGMVKNIKPLANTSFLPLLVLQYTGGGQKMDKPECGIPAKIWGGEWKGKQGTRKKPREISLRAREQS